MPSPISTPLTARRSRVSAPRVTAFSAKYETTIAIASDRNVSRNSQPSGIGSENASMPTKCIAQMPVLIAAAPPASHASRIRGLSRGEMSALGSSAV